MRVQQLVAGSQWQDAARVGEWVQHDGGVGPRLYDFIEITQGSVAYRLRQRSVMPARPLCIKQPAPDKIAGREVVVAGHRDERFAQSPRHVLHKARLAAAGRAFEQQRKAQCIGGFEGHHFVSLRCIVGLQVQPPRLKRMLSRHLC